MHDIETAYLMLVNIRSPAPEHAQIRPVLERFASSTPKAIYFDKHGGAFVFMTKLHAPQIYARFDEVLLNEDSVLIVELGGDWFTFGNNIAAGWFQHNLPKAS